MRDYLPLIRKDSSTHMHGLAVYVKEGLPFAWDLSLENSPDSYLCFRLILSNIEEVLSINPSANVFAFGDFNAHHKDWLTYSGGTNRPSEVCYNLILSQTTLLRWLTFLLRSQTVILTVQLFWIYLDLLMLVFVL